MRIDELRSGSDAGQPPAWLSLGFRPFFLLAGLAALGLMLAWLGSWHGEATAESYYGRIGWHGHEMLFGYVVAVMAGFLLTAVRNWTGRATATGTALAGLAGLWLLGRVLPWLPAAPAWLIAIVDLSFLPALAAALAGPLWRGENRVNRRFLALLLAMAAANAAMHAEALGAWDGGLATGLTLMLDLVLVLLIWVGGRVVPFFIQVAVAGARADTRPGLEVLGMALALAVALAHLVPGGQGLASLLLVALACQQVVRTLRWHHPGIWAIPILWILFCGQLWLVAAAALRAASGFELVPDSVAVHALTAGAFGVFTLGMMARVALGHTGRPMRSHRRINLAFVLLNLGAAARVFGPWLAPAAYVAWVMLAGLLWCLAFTLFLWVYGPILTTPRVDHGPPVAPPPTQS